MDKKKFGNRKVQKELNGTDTESNTIFLMGAFVSHLNMQYCSCLKDILRSAI